MKEYYGLYGEAKAEPSHQAEPKPLAELSENDISKQFDSENAIEPSDLEWSLYFRFFVIIYHGRG